jgi:hypothetical protein
MVSVSDGVIFKSALATRQRMKANGEIPGALGSI